MTKLPSGVDIMLRMTPPPDGIAQVWNFCVAGSNLTIVFGRTPDSLYQTSLPNEAMPYGSDSLPPGDSHSANCFVLGSYLPMVPRAKSAHQITSSEVMAMRRGRASAFGSVISVIARVFGSTLA